MMSLLPYTAGLNMPCAHTGAQTARRCPVPLRRIGYKDAVTGKRYRYKQVQEKSMRRRKEACKPSKMTPEMIAAIEPKLRIQWSPEQVSGWLLEEEEELISYESIYLHVWAVIIRRFNGACSLQIG